MPRQAPPPGLRSVHGLHHGGEVLIMQRFQYLFRFLLAFIPVRIHDLNRQRIIAAGHCIGIQLQRSCVRVFRIQKRAFIHVRVRGNTCHRLPDHGNKGLGRLCVILPLVLYLLFRIRLGQADIPACPTVLEIQGIQLIKETRIGFRRKTEYGHYRSVLVPHPYLMTTCKSFPIKQVIRHFHVRTIFHAMPSRAHRIMKIRTQLILVKDMDIRHDFFQQVENPCPHIHEPAQVLLIQFQGIVFLFGIFGILIKCIRQFFFHPLRRFMEHCQVKRRLKMAAGRIEVRPFIIHQLHQLIIHPAVVIPVRHMTDGVKIQNVPRTQPPDDIVQVGHIAQ